MSHGGIDRLLPMAVIFLDNAGCQLFSEGNVYVDIHMSLTQYGHGDAILANMLRLMMIPSSRIPLSTYLWMTSYVLPSANIWEHGSERPPCVTQIFFVDASVYHRPQYRSRRTWVDISHTGTHQLLHLRLHRQHPTLLQSGSSSAALATTSIIHVEIKLGCLTISIQVMPFGRASPQDDISDWATIQHGDVLCGKEGVLSQA